MLPHDAQFLVNLTKSWINTYSPSLSQLHSPYSPSLQMQCGENWHSYYLLALFRTPLCLVLSLGCDIFPFSSLQIYRRHWLLSRPLYKYISSQLLWLPTSSDPRLCVSSSHWSWHCRSGTQTCNGKPVINLCYHLAVAAHVWRFRSPDLWAWWLLKYIKTKANGLFSPVLCVCVCAFRVAKGLYYRMRWSAEATAKYVSLCKEDNDFHSIKRLRRGTQVIDKEHNEAWILENHNKCGTRGAEASGYSCQ